MSTASAICCALGVPCSLRTTAVITPACTKIITAAAVANQASVRGLRLDKNSERRLGAAMPQVGADDRDGATEARERKRWITIHTHTANTANPRASLIGSPR